jgi:hypothetical protein
MMMLARGYFGPTVNCQEVCRRFSGRCHSGRVPTGRCLAAILLIELADDPVQRCSCCSSTRGPLLSPSS